MKAYKSEQGRMVRMGAFWVLALLYMYGCMSLHQTLSGFVDRLNEPLLGSLPILGWRLTGSFLISALLFLSGFYGLWSWHQTPKVADLLIETEAELQRVTWAKMPDVINSSIVVIIFVLFLMAFLAGADIVLSRIFGYILTGSAS
jgi:preprotein translocase SecE subunit